MNNIYLKRTLISIAIALSTGSPNVFGFDTDEVNQSSYEQAYKALDTDNNGSLSELEASKSEFFTKKHFAMADANHDGNLTLEEFREYKSEAEKKNLKRVVSDSTITSKIKANLIKDHGLKSLKISVETHKGIVILSGFVKTTEQIIQAEKIATATTGVITVKNRLELKNSD